MNETIGGLQRRLCERYCVVESLLDFGQGTMYRLPGPIAAPGAVRCPDGRVALLSVSSIDQLLEKVTDEDSIPFWAEVWESAIGLAHHLETCHGGSMPGVRVLELGCGIGTVGLAAAAMGAVCTMLDFAVDAVEFARLNALRNGIGMAGSVDGSPNGTVVPVVADIRTFLPGDAHDVIVGSDILYEPRLHKDIIRLMDGCLKPGGKAVFADPGRKWVSVFIDLLKPKGWLYDLDEVPVVSDKGRKTIDIITLFKPGTQVDMGDSH